MLETTTLTSKGQLTVPMSFRKKLGLKPGDKVAFVEGEDGNTYLVNASTLGLRIVQASFAGAAEEIGVKSEEDVDTLIYQLRHSK